MIQNKTLYSIINQTCYLEMIGVLTHSNTSGLDVLIKSEIEKKNVNTFAIKMDQTNRIDSSVIGILVRILKYMKKIKPLLIAPQKDIVMLLSNLGLMKYFIIEEEYPGFPESLSDTDELKKSNNQPNIEFLND